MRKYLFQTALIGMAIACLGLSESFCQEGAGLTPDIDSLSLKELLNIKVTTVSKTSQSLERAPASAIVITQEQIKLRGYQSLLDVLYDLPDFKVDDKVNGQSRNVTTLRGTPGQDKFIIMLDGVRITSPTNEILPIMENYPVNFAEQIEIVYGPASALYGADAVSGVINIITKKAPSRKNVNIDASALAGTNGATNNTLFLSSKIGKRVNLAVSGQYYYDPGHDYSKVYADDSLYSATPLQTGTFNSIYGPMTPEEPVSPKFEAPMEAYNIYAAMHIDNFTVAMFRNYSKIPSAYENNTNNAVYNKDVFMAQHVNMLSASYKKSFGSITSSTSLMASEYVLAPESNYRNLYTGMERGYKYSYGSMIKGEQQIDWKPSEKFNIVGGLGYENYYSVPQSADLVEPVDQSHALHGTNLGTKSYYNPEGMQVEFYTVKYYNIGAYLQAQYAPFEKINFTIGTRCDYNSRFGRTVNPRAGIVYAPFPKTTIKALYGSAFLAPAPYDNYAQYGSFVTSDSGKTYQSYFLHLPNPDLEPIKSHNVELSVRQYLNNNISVTLNGYYTWLTNLHALADDNETTQLYNNSFNGVPVDYVEVFVNQNRQQNYGGNIQINHKQKFGRVKMNNYAAFSYVTGKIDNAMKESEETKPDEELDYIAPFMFRIGSDIKYGKFSLSTRLILMGRQNVTGLSGETGAGGIAKRQTIPGYALLNFSVRYNVLKNLSIFANVTNALNQHYRISGYETDINKTETEHFPGQHSDPIRVMGGINFTL